MIEGEPWFVAKDVALTLGYKDTINAISTHCKGVAKHHPLFTPGGTQEVRVIQEPNVYRLVAKSKLPSAEKFERWIFEEVLPTLRKTGSYSMTPAPVVPEHKKTPLPGKNEKNQVRGPETPTTAGGEISRCTAGRH
jgi:prophage antirepressor-like protein